MRSGFPVLLLALSIAAGPARADEPEGADKSRAREAFLAGKAHHDAGEYEEAASDYLRAYELYPHPILLYNVAQVKRLSGEHEAALEHYRRYLELEPQGPAAARARRFAAELEAGLETGEGSGPRPGAAGGLEPETTPPPLPERSPPPPPPSREADLEPAQPSPSERGRSGSPGRVKRLSGLVIAGVGVLSLGLSVQFGLEARRKSEEASGLVGTYDPTEHDPIFERGEAAERNMFLFAGAGVLAVAGGGALYYLGLREARVAPAARDRGAGLVVSGRF